MSTCCICTKAFPASELYVSSHDGDGCLGAPLICPECRKHPGALDVARDLLEEHLTTVPHAPITITAYDPWMHIPQTGSLDG